MVFSLLGPSLSDKSALGFAMAEGDAKLVREILRTGLHVDSLVPFLEGDLDQVWSVTALIAAAFHNNAEMVTLFLEEQADVDGGSHLTSLNSMFVLGLTPLQVASLYDSTDILQKLLFSGADLNRPAHEEKHYSELDSVGTALQTAAFKGHLVQCKILLNAGANVNAAAGAMGFTALQAAAQSQKPSIVKILLEAGADINTPASPGEGLTALQAAVPKGDFDLVNYLLNKGADINAPAASTPHGLRRFYNYGMTALSAAAQQDNQQLVSLLLAHGSDVNGRSPKKGAETALTAAVKNNNEIVAYLLLASGANVDDSNALLAATENGNDKFVELLLSLRASSLSPPMEGYGSTALKSAISRGRYDLVRMLLASGIDVNEPVLDHVYSFSPGGSRFEPKHVLDAAVIKGSPAMVQTLLDAGADPNLIVPNWSMNILQHATHFKRADMVRMLLNAGTNPNTPAKGKRGRTALQAAAGNGCFDLVELLLEARADTNAAPARDGGATALQAAAIGGYCGIVSKLLKAGADVNAAGAVINGRTAIEGAAEHGRIDVLQLLLDNGALIEGPGKAQYDRAISFAVERGNHTARRLLQSHHEELYGFK